MVFFIIPGVFEPALPGGQASFLTSGHGSSFICSEPHSHAAFSQPTECFCNLYAGEVVCSYISITGTGNEQHFHENIHVVQLAVVVLPHAGSPAC